MFFSLLLIGALLSCHGPGLIKSTGEPHHQAVVSTMDEVDAHNGEFVKIVGKFARDSGTNGSMTTDSGLVVFLPHMDEFLAGQPWHNYVGKQVVAIGRVRKSIANAKGETMPSLVVQYLKVVE